MSNAVFRLSRGKHAACVRNGMRAFTSFFLHESSADSKGRSVCAHGKRQLVIWECQNWRMSKSVFESSETVLLSIVPKEGHILLEKPRQRRGNRGKIFFTKDL